MKLLEIKNLKSGYGKMEVLRGVSIELDDKEIVSIIGPNGAGKSTIIKSIFNIANVYSGEILKDGKSIRNLKTHELIGNGVSYVPQGRIIFGNLTVKENLRMGGDLLENPDEVDKRINEICEKFPVLKERIDTYAFTLSGGERQMLALGRALIMKPTILLLDEPSLGLSPKFQKEVFETISKLRENFGVSLIIVEQNAKKAIEISDRTYLLEDGKVALKGGKEILKKKKIKSVYLGGRY